MEEQELKLKWWREGNALCAQCEAWLLVVHPNAGGGFVWRSEFMVGDDGDSINWDGSFDDDENPLPLDSELDAQHAAEHSLRLVGERIAGRLGIGGTLIERLGLRRRPPEPTDAGEITVEGLYDRLREVVEALGAHAIEGEVRGVRESKRHNLYFTLHVGPLALQCRLSSSMARALPRPVEREQFRVRGVPTVFGSRGEVQFDVIGIEAAVME